jgi:hypothetical protein
MMNHSSAVMPSCPAFGYPVAMIYKVVADTIPDCDCADCRAGRHPYSLFRLRDGEWIRVAIGLQAYATPEDCMRRRRSSHLAALDALDGPFDLALVVCGDAG